MKKLYTLLAAVLLTATVWAQSPNKMSYQAVVRDANNELVSNAGIGMQISILQGSADGSSVYTETQSPTSNNNGLVTLEIGMGTTSDDFSTINWSADPYFIKIETDPTAAGGTNYTITGTSQLMSVPYALYAETSTPQTISQTGNEVTLSDGGGSVTITDTQLDAAGVTALGFVSGAHTTYTAGTGIDITSNVISSTGSSPNSWFKFALGGYIIGVGPDGKHGLVVALQDQSSSVTWYASNDVFSNAANHTTDGANFKDWRLPTKRELNLMYTQKTAIDIAAAANGGAAFAADNYWSSTEVDDTNARVQNFGFGGQGLNDKSTTYYVRGVRAF